MPPSTHILCLLLLAGCTPSHDTDVSETGGDTGLISSGPMLGFCDAWDTPNLGDGISTLQLHTPTVEEASEVGLRLARPHRPSGHVFAMDAVFLGDNQWDWSKTDYLVQASGALDVQLLVTLQPTVDLDDPDVVATSLAPMASLGLWQGYVRRVVERYDGDGIEDMPGLVHPVMAYEIGNEPFCPPGETACYDDYLTTVQTAWEAAHEVDPQVVVMAGGAMPVFQQGIEGPVEERKVIWQHFFDHGGAQFTDAFSFHVTTGLPEPLFASSIAEWREVVPADMPLWLSESGPYGVDGHGSHDDPKVAADWYVSQLRQAREAGVEQALWCLAKGRIDEHPELLEALEAYVGEGS